MPGAEIYLALSRGTIDAGEFSVPECDWSMGFHEVTKYWVLPGWHQPGPASGVMINKKAFDYIDPEVAVMLPTAPPYQGKTWIPNVEWWVDRDQEIQERWKAWVLK